MPEFLFIEEPSASQIDEIVSLYLSEGWWQPGKDVPDLVRRIVAGSHCFLIAVESGRVIGMGRAISDGYSDAYIQDVTVSDRYRGQGIGSSIVKILQERLHKDGVRWVGLIAEKNSHAFYERLGFGIMNNSVPMVKIDI